MEPIIDFFRFRLFEREDFIALFRAISNAMLSPPAATVNPFFLMGFLSEARPLERATDAKRPSLTVGLLKQLRLRSAAGVSESDCLPLLWFRRSVSVGIHLPN